MATSTNLCEMCEQPGTQRCGGCKQVHYCSTTCQKQSWKEHKILCKDVQNFSDEHRPPPNGSNSMFRRSILFAPDEEAPRFVWVEFKKQDVSGELYELPVLEPFDIETKKSGLKYIQQNMRLQREFLHVILMRYRDSFYNDGSQRNEAVRKVITSGLRDKVQEWREPVLATALEEFDYAPGVPSRDLNTSDLRHIIDWFHSKPAYHG
ncbi:hypothetical protein BDV95DRAFT_610055 [Massariosphaeria phaeospora]|uniref:MYND-type domain-containing protein n=1 Tax=Massariosphaeria phaeospora TaxID=100035 RepID=A0A7C8M2G9_9PLEO|nr:hypothetical protein BDV95DRAFT_610055 [Massariosphaeria phaeospora]